MAARAARMSPNGGSSATGVALVVETPLLFEAGLEGYYDATIAIVADEKVRERAGCGARARRARRAHRPRSSLKMRRPASDLRCRELRHARGTGAGAVGGPCEADEMSARTATARTTARSPRRPSRARRRQILRRRLLLLAGFALTVAAVLSLAGKADKAVQELMLPLRHEDIIRQQAADKDLDPALIAAVIYTESHFRDQTSHAGAKGLMQLMPSTADYIARKSGGTRFERADLATPQINIAYGTWYLRYLLTKYHGNTVLTLAAYNAGEAVVDQWWRQRVRARRALHRRRPHPVPGDARLRRPRAVGRAASTARATRASWAFERGLCGPRSSPASAGHRASASRSRGGWRPGLPARAAGVRARRAAARRAGGPPTGAGARTSPPTSPTRRRPERVVAAAAASSATSTCSSSTTPLVRPGPRRADRRGDRRALAINVRASLLLVQAFHAATTAARAAGRDLMTSGQHRGPMPRRAALRREQGRAAPAHASAWPRPPGAEADHGQRREPGRDGHRLGDEADPRGVLERREPFGRWGKPDDAARLIAFLARRTRTGSPAR